VPVPEDKMIIQVELFVNDKKALNNCKIKGLAEKVTI